ncbi:MAG: metal ABC transporter permease [Sulfobacillus thermotolerans]|nr:metal ABC transporter permease [Sulfobacillus thermotolerans]
MFRPLLLSSAVPEFAAARGVSLTTMNVVFTVLVALAASLTVPVVGALLAFSLMIGPAAAGWYLGKSPSQAMAYAVLVALGSVWISIVIGYDTSLPVGFLVATFCMLAYGGARWIHSARNRHVSIKAQILDSNG